jgi:GAF domain-containing protein
MNGKRRSGHMHADPASQSFRSSHLSSPSVSSIRAKSSRRWLRRPAVNFELGQHGRNRTNIWVISRSAFDLQTVLDTLVASAARLCDAEMVNIWRPSGTSYRLVANYVVAEKHEEGRKNKEYLERLAIEPGRGSIVGRTLLEGRAVHVNDIQADPEYELGGILALGDYRTTLGVPLLRQGFPIGVLFLTRMRVQPFTKQQIELVETFADQAVIAMENVRLFDEVQARTRELTQSIEELRALGDVSQAVNSTLDLQTVLDTIVARAAQLSGTEAGAIYVFDEANRQFQLRATYGMTTDMITVIQEHHTDFSEAVRGATQRREPDQVGDLQPSSRANNLHCRRGSVSLAFLLRWRSASLPTAKSNCHCRVKTLQIILG